MRLLLIEDEPDLGAAIKKVLNQETYVVDWILDGNQAWSYLETQWTEYTLAIIDWMLPGMSGLELCKRLRANHSSLPILMLTSKDRMEEKIIGLDAGADDYLVKPFKMPELLARLRALRRRSPQLQPPQLQAGNLTLNYGTHSVTHQDITGNEKRFIPLTIKEFQLLEYFMKHPNQIVNRDQIMNQLWEVDEEPISNVVAAQVRLLRRKLEDNDNSLIETIYGVGYRFNPSL
ncbi:MAG: response regulator transcription factor [Leptolyngbyaceae cyanobacterium SL_5_9]|nr:response regulator transcription factor [Leptolyngbyaceae cyanobacterium SL_5_9]NJO76036.1 response regulator transcription factor [Leptolyngbyaceae cyanobacterium RM1_406_9]